MDPFEQRLAADLAAIADTLPPLGPAARQQRRTPPLTPLAATVAVLTIALGAAYVATSGSPSTTDPAQVPSTPAATPAEDPTSAVDAPTSSAASPAVPDDPAGAPPESFDTIRVADRINNQLMDLPGAGKVQLDDDTGVVTVFWAGPVPAEVQAEAGPRPNGVVVRILPSTYSMAELQAAMERIPVADYPAWESLSPTQTLSGLVVNLDGAWLAGQDLAALEADLSEAAGVPVKVRAV